MYWRVWIIGFCLWCALCFSAECASAGRGGLLYPTRSQREWYPYSGSISSILPIPHTHTLSSRPQKHFPLCLSSPLLSVNSEHFFLAREHSVITFFVALLSEVIPSHQLFLVFLFPLPKLRLRSVWIRICKKKKKWNTQSDLLSTWYYRQMFMPPQPFSLTVLITCQREHVLFIQWLRRWGRAKKIPRPDQARADKQRHTPEQSHHRRAEGLHWKHLAPRPPLP